jgi:hypothetical protein
VRKPIRAFWGAALLLATAAWAAPDRRPNRLVVDQIQGDPGTLHRQLIRELCGPVPCVPLTQVTTRRRVDPRKLSGARGLLLTGRETGKRSRSVTLRLESRPGRSLGRYSFPVGRRGLSQAALATLQDAVQKALGTAPAAATPLSPAPPPKVPGPVASGTRPRSGAAPSASAGRTPAPTNPRARPASQVAPALAGTEGGTALEEATPARGAALPLFAIELGVSGVNLSHEYSDLTTQNLRGYSADFALVPRALLESFPLARSEGFVRGFGLEAEAQLAVGLRSAIEGGPEHDTTYRVLDGVLKYRWASEAGFRVEPLVGYRLATFRVEPVNGASITGLPTLDYDGLELGVGLGYPLGRVLLLARARFLPLLASGEVLSTDYFNSGSLWGVDLEAGVGVRLFGGLSVRGMGEYTRYHFTFRTQPGDVFQATGATSRYAGGRLMLRYDFD